MTSPGGNKLRVVVADDERPARAFLVSILETFEDVDVVGEAPDGAACVELIERVQPDLALLDLQMPEVDGLGVVQLLRRERLPLIAFVTAYDEHAVRAFELNAVDYVLKPVDAARLRSTVNRALERLERATLHADEAERLRSAASDYASSLPRAPLRRIPVRKRDDIFLVAVEQLASIVADGELLRLTTTTGERYTISYRLKDLEARLDPTQFVRVSRGTLVNMTQIERITAVAGAMYTVVLRGGAEHPVSRLRSRIIREQLLRL